MNFVSHAFPFGFRKSEKGRATFRARFEAIAIGSFLALQEHPEIITKDPASINVDAWINSNEFIDATGADGANAKARLKGRIDFVRTRLVQV
jgi:hypothetical protein